MGRLPKVTGRGAELVSAVDTVDLVETERMVRTLIADGWMRSR